MRLTVVCRKFTLDALASAEGAIGALEAMSPNGARLVETLSVANELATFVAGGGI